MPPGYRQFAPHDELPSTFPNALSSFLAGAAFGFRVIIKLDAPTVLQVPASEDNPAARTVAGKWRYVTAPVERASPGGAAQTFDVYVTASDNSFGTASDDVGPYEVDNTDYSFALALVASGAAAPAADLTQKVATADWNGSAFTSVTPVVASQPDVPLVTSLPADPPNDMRVDYLTTDANHAVWHLRYVEALNGWVCTGGSPNQAVGDAETDYNFEQNAWRLLYIRANLQSLTLPLTGVYDFDAEASIQPTNTGGALLEAFGAGTSSGPIGGIVFPGMQTIHQNEWGHVKVAQRSQGPIAAGTAVSWGALFSSDVTINYRSVALRIMPVFIPA